MFFTAARRAKICMWFSVEMLSLSRVSPTQGERFFLTNEMPLSGRPSRQVTVSISTVPI